MGKVKLTREEAEQALKEREKYQFPMGKVKSSLPRRRRRVETVSIPYGKGKVIEKKKVTVIEVSIPHGKSKGKRIPNSVRIISYQFPMGKVKMSNQFHSCEI